MKNILLISGIFVLVLGLAAVAGANLIQNGDFEKVDNRVGEVNGIRLDQLNTGARWDVYDTLPGGWYTDNQPGIEVQYSGVVYPAHSPSHYIELDSHPNPGSNSSALQDLLGLAAGDYTLSL